MYAKPKVLVPLRRRSKPAQKHKKRALRYKVLKSELAFAEYYKDAIF